MRAVTYFGGLGKIRYSDRQSIHLRKRNLLVKKWNLLLSKLIYAMCVDTNRWWSLMKFTVSWAGYISIHLAETILGGEEN